ncbi:alpha/beta fold hydrolase [Actinoallomurus spadix]|uniref:Alpha/beta fold hydrolase n=1 Tax=Actinoallomurus spadix TaxID=79912 RepID=A0ABP3FE85_9ACTN|nr:alpha/beta fold hydrolase [Actinoallomurus spadix]MCO5991230.1 alpha/beta fold hydrolase [Actinoallomurus spadix]
MSPPSLLRFRDIHGYWRAFRMTGSGPPLLLIHGIGDDSGTWEKVIPRLAEHHTVIAPDLLGHGDSAKPRADYAIAAYACGMRDLLGVLEIDRVSVVGHSLGGGIAMQFAYQFPERCERLLLVAPGGIGREVHPLLRAAAAPGAELGLSLATSVPARTAVRLAAPALRLTGGLFLGADFDYILRRYRGLRTRKARQAFLRSLRAGVDVRGQVITMLDRCYLAEGMPILIIWGREDRVIPVGHAEVAHAAMPGSRLEIFGRCGHFPHHDDPDRFVTTVERFLETTEPALHDPARWRRLLRAGRDAARGRPENPAPHVSSGA